MVNTPDEIWTLLRKVNDPEIPVLNVVEMGVVRNVRPLNEGWEVDITPTYSGCPAMDTIEADIKQAFRTAKIPVEVMTVLAPAWTTDWITDEAKQKLQKQQDDKLKAEQQAAQAEEAARKKAQANQSFKCAASEALSIVPALAYH